MDMVGRRGDARAAGARVSVNVSTVAGADLAP
jgi:hypothetical protein